MARSRKLLCVLVKGNREEKKAMEGPKSGDSVEKWKKSDYVSPVGGIQQDHYYSLN